ncbi:hypothetical protein [Thalassospira sp. TSL5-1]|uniref:hypothetical protein n=1 Tax=Thalassospira sp. TSL5-1 TaxID=1544451 RepID=UPI0011611CF6|nr:hypothetical protein [Thalassospira sp. TSL5-1]
MDISAERFLKKGVARVSMHGKFSKIGVDKTRETGCKSARLSKFSSLMSAVGLPGDGKKFFR